MPAVTRRPVVNYGRGNFGASARSTRRGLPRVVMYCGDKRLHGDNGVTVERESRICVSVCDRAKQNGCEQYDTRYADQDHNGFESEFRHTQSPGEPACVYAAKLRSAVGFPLGIYARNLWKALTKGKKPSMRRMTGRWGGIGNFLGWNSSANLCGLCSLHIELRCDK